MFVKRRTCYILFILPAAALLLSFLFYPIAHNLKLSFSVLIPSVRFVGLRNYLQIMHDPIFWISAKVTFLWTAGVYVMTFILSIAGAIILNQKFPGRLVFKISIFLPWTIAYIVGALTWRWLYHSQLGGLSVLLSYIGCGPVRWLGDEKLALWSVIITQSWRTFPFVTIILLAGLQQIPGELREAAKLDGANTPQILMFIVMPCMVPLLLILSLLVLIWSVNAFTLIYVMTGGGPLNSTLVLGMNVYETAFLYMKFGLAAALAVVLFCITFVFIGIYIYLQVYLHAGD